MPQKLITNAPQDIHFLNSNYIDFGFENLKLSPNQLTELVNAYVTSGVNIPELNYRLSYTDGFVRGRVKGNPTLPVNWLSMLVIYDENGELVYFGKKSRKDQRGNINISNFRDIGWGYFNYS